MTVEAGGENPSLGIVILGASAFPYFSAERRLDNESFGRSAEAFQALFASSGVSVSASTAVLDLFNSDKDPARVIRAIKDFLRLEPSILDVVIYYCGHGDFLADTQKTYILTLRGTEPDNEAFTALPLRQMRISLEHELSNKRVFLVLDCCFAGYAVTEWQSDSVGHVIEEQVFNTFSRRGTALIAAAARGEPAVAPGNEPLTMFTGAFVQTVREGVPGLGRQLSFRDVFARTKDRIIRQFGASAAIPAIHAPHQPDGDISFDPFFINRAYREDGTETPATLDDILALALDELSRPLPRTRLAALTVLNELLDQPSADSIRGLIFQNVVRVRDEDDSFLVRARAGEIVEAMADAVVSPTPVEEPEADIRLFSRLMEEAERLNDAGDVAIKVGMEATAQADLRQLASPTNDGSERPPDVRLQLPAIWILAFVLLAAALLLAVAWGWVWRGEGSAPETVRVTDSPPTMATSPRPTAAAPVPTIEPNTASSGNAAIVASGPSVPEARLTDAAGLASPDLEPRSNAQALLLEASEDGSTGAVPFSGSVDWSKGTDETGLPMIVGKASIPARNLGIDVLIRKNADASLPASHLMEITFSVSDTFIGGSIAHLPGVLLKNEELVQGTPLQGASARVVGNSFLFALSATAEDSASNYDLLTSRKWIDLAIIYATGKRAIVTLEKDDAAEKLFRDVFASWGPAPTASAQ